MATDRRKARWELELEEYHAQSQPFHGGAPSLSELKDALIALARSNVLDQRTRLFLQNLTMYVNKMIYDRKDRKSGRTIAGRTWLAAETARLLQEKFEDATEDQAVIAVVGDDGPDDIERVSRALRKLKAGKAPGRILVFDDDPILIQAAARLGRSIKQKRKQ